MALTDTAMQRIYESLFRASTLIGTLFRPNVVVSEMASGVHNGVGYLLNSYNAALATAGTVIFFGKTNAKNVNFLGLDVTTSVGGWNIELYEAPTVTADGTLQTPINLNLQSANVNGMTVFAGGTVSANGIIKLSTRIHTSGTGSANRVTAGSSLSAGMILKRNTTYMFRITNNSGAAAAYEANLLWVEK